MDQIKNRGNNALVDAFKQVFNPSDPQQPAMQQQ